MESAGSAVADHFQAVVVEPATAESNLSTPGRKRPAADGATLDLAPVRGRPLTGVPVRSLRKSAALRGCGLRDQSQQRGTQQRAFAASHRQRLSRAWASVWRLFPAFPARSTAPQSHARAGAATREFPSGV